MSETTYTVEVAKSGRSKCKKCKEPIGKGDVRIGCHVPKEEGFSMTSWNHTGCFRLPQKYSRGPNKMSPEDFIRDILEDSEGLLEEEEKLNEVVRAMEEADKNKGKRKSAGGSSGGPIDEIKAAYEVDQKLIAESKMPASKKQKTGNLAAKLDAYGKYQKAKNGELQDILRWNNQVMKGNKDLMLAKVIDGVVYGRLSRCELCGGTLKMTDPDAKGIICGGGFDEETQRRIPCSFKCKPEDAPRWQPWYETEPTEEEKEAMTELIEAYKEAEGKPAAASGKEDEDVSKLVAAAEEIDPFDLSTTEGLKAAVTELQEILAKSAKKVDMPENKKQARTKILEIANMHRDDSASDLMQKLVKAFGFVEAKEKKKAQKLAAVESNVGCSANAPIVAVLTELSELYFKEGNRNAGASYVKATQAIQGVKYEITAENAMAMTKAKTKVQGIGKGTAEKIKEFLETGTIQKLEEKRADAA